MASQAALLDATTWQAWPDALVLRSRHHLFIHPDPDSYLAPFDKDASAVLFRFPASNGGSAYGLAARAELTVKQRSRMLSKVLDMLEDPEPAEWAWSPVRDMSDAAFTLLYPASRAPAGRAERMTSRG